MASAYEPVIGLEVHAQLLSRSKLFCGCSTAFGAPPNTHTCPVCLGLPGALPVPNRGAVLLALRAALALGCEVRQRSRFARKNYFYPDLAKGYQISQYELPLNEHGRLAVETEDGAREVGITRVHMEEDAAKNLHGVGSGTKTLVDFNRAGVPLIEVVGAPELRSAAEAESYLRRLREVLMFVGVNDGNLEEGSFRCDANVSLRPVGSEKLGTRTELKNINSFRFVRKALEYEIARQQAVLASGGKVIQETRAWSEAQGKTVSMRGKEEAQDYRYFPDPDLPPLQVTEAMLAEARESVPELPAQRRARWERELGLTAYDAQVLTGHPAVAAFFEDAVEALVEAMSGKLPPVQAGKRVANFVQAEVLRHVTTEGLEGSIPVSPAHLAELLGLVEKGTLSGKMAKEVLAEVVRTGQGPGQVVEAKGLSQVSDVSVIEAEARKVLEANPGQVAQYKGGKQNLIGYFVGQVMKATKGSANPKTVNEVLRKLLDA